MTIDSILKRVPTVRTNKGQQTRRRSSPGSRVLPTQLLASRMTVMPEVLTAVCFVAQLIDTELQLVYTLGRTTMVPPNLHQDKFENILLSAGR